MLSMKKRIFSAIIAFALFIICSVPSFAAEGGGYFTPYDVTVTAESGAVLYDIVWNEDMTRSAMRPMTVLAPVGTPLTVTDEVEFNGELYLAIEYGGFYAYIQRPKITLNVQNADETSAFSTAASYSRPAIDWIAMVADVIWFVSLVPVFSTKTYFAGKVSGRIK